MLPDKTTILILLQVSGDAVRELLKIPSDANKFKYQAVPDFEVFVQSTSYNRVLIPETKFLYEVDSAAGGIRGPGGVQAARGKVAVLHYDQGVKV